jgi:Amidase
MDVAMRDVPEQVVIAEQRMVDQAALESLALARRSKGWRSWTCSRGQSSAMPAKARHHSTRRIPERFTCGSSSGPASAVAAGLADIGVGRDTGGSIRAPAHPGA